jgi:hypothetical protein
MKAKLFLTLIGGALVSASFAMAAIAQTFDCPPPQQINCVPAVKSVGGWKDNNSQATGNSFGANDQCANVIKLAPNKQRLLCCYAKCGVFLRDVNATSCTKTSESQFTCQ